LKPLKPVILEFGEETILIFKPFILGLKPLKPFKLYIGIENH
jgi:predicted DNA-binding antitoxin AbrB/MazE fold protein